MAPTQKQLTPALHAGAEKPQNEHGQGATVIPKADDVSRENMLRWTDIDFSEVIPNPFLTLAMMATSSEGGNANLKALPAELLIRIAGELSPEDKLATAFALPDLFINTNVYHIFNSEATLLLHDCTRLGTDDFLGWQRRPLVLTAIANNYSFDQIQLILDSYERVARALDHDPNILLNSEFPNNRPIARRYYYPGDNDGRGDIMAPLHAAILASRLDIVKDLIRRGANTKQFISTNFRAADPLQLAIDTIFCSHTYPDGGIGLEDIALELAPYYPDLRAYTDDHRDLSPQMDAAIRGGSDRVALYIFEREAEKALALDDETKLSRPPVPRNLVLTSILRMTAASSMPETLRYILDDGARYTETAEYTQPFHKSMTHAVLDGRNHVEHAATCLRWEVETNDPTLPTSINLVALYARDDRYLETVKPLARVLAELNNEEGQNLLLLNALFGRDESAKTKKWLLENIDVGNGVALRFSIVFADEETTAFIMKRLIDSRRSLDEVLTEDTPLCPRPGIAAGWYNTPLTYAIAQGWYHPAAQLLSLGADPKLVPLNIRHRVRVTRERVIASMSRWARWERLNQAHDYVCLRILDDPEFPLPAYERHRSDSAASYVEDHRDLLRAELAQEAYCWSS